MNQEILAYIDYLSDFKEIKKPQMPNFEIEAYTDIEYHKAINEINEEYDRVDDFGVYENFLKGE